jgi:hypothetical protein
MERQHINERGSHTTVIEAARPILVFFAKNILGEKLEISPGKIEGGVGARSKSIKFKHINNEVYEMVITHNGARQEFKIITKTSADILLQSIKQDKKLRDWNINYVDMRGANNASNLTESKKLDEKYRVK